MLVINKNKMKIFGLVLLMAVMADARRGGRHGRGKDIHRDRNGVTRAACSFNTDKEGRDLSAPKGYMKLTQAASDDDSAPTSLESYMGTLVPDTTYTLNLLDDDQDACAGTLLTEVGTATASDK